MAGLKDADDFQKGERFKGAGFLSMASLVIGAVAIVIFFGIAFTSGGNKNPGTSDSGEPKVEHNSSKGEGTDCEESGTEESEEKEDTTGYSKRDAMAYSWLFAVVFFLTLAVGGLFWTLLHNATNSGWGTAVRRMMENLGILIPFVMVLAVPLLIEEWGFRDALWEWFADRDKAVETAKLEAKGELESYTAEVRGKATKAAEAVAALEKEKAAKGNISPGHQRFLEDAIAELRDEANKLGTRAEKGNEELMAELVDKEFKHVSPLLYAKRVFLEEGFWGLRFLIYALVLGGGIFVLRSLSLRQDKSGDPELFTRMRGLSCLLLLPFALSWTFFVFDWLMALDYTWFSTMWGVYLFAGSALNSMGVIVLTVSWLRSKGYLRDVINEEHYHIMGKLMHAFVIFWAYIAFSQYFLIWYANITEETKFFLMRNTAFWNTYSIIFLVLGHFFIPFVVLLLRKCKTTTWMICTVAIWNLLMHAFDIYWIIIPERGPSLTEGNMFRLPGMWVYDVLAFVGVGGIFIFLLLRMLNSGSLYPCRDPRLDESLNLTN